MTRAMRVSAGTIRAIAAPTRSAAAPPCLAASAVAIYDALPPNERESPIFNLGQHPAPRRTKHQGCPDKTTIDFLYADDTFVNPVLARHYDLPGVDVRSNEWVRVDHANRYGRGGLLPMLPSGAHGSRLPKRLRRLVYGVQGRRLRGPAIAAAAV